MRNYLKTPTRTRITALPPSFLPPQAQKSEPVHEHVTEDCKGGATFNQTSSNSLQINASSLLHLSFNEDHAFFAAGTDQGLRLYNCEPFGKRDFVPFHGFGIVEMFGSNIFALVGGRSNPEYPPTRVMIWDNTDKKCRGVVHSKYEIKAVRLLRKYIIIVSNQNICICRISDLRIVHKFDTDENRKGLCAVSQLSSYFMLVCPGSQRGQVWIQDFSTRSATPKYIAAHTSEIACFALSKDGKLLATASTKGTLIRTFSTSDASLQQEVRRGADKADIYSLAFSSTSQWLAVLSDKETVHVFAVKFNSGMLEDDNVQSVSGLNFSAPLSRSSFYLMQGALRRYFSSERSVAKFRLPKNIKYTVGFGQEKNTVIIVGMDGSFYRCQFDPATGGEMVQLQFCNILYTKTQ